MDYIYKTIRNKFTSILYTFSSGLIAIAQIISSIIIIKYIKPSELGIWNSVKLLSVYSFFLLLGINNGLNRELPFLFGNNKINQAEIMAGVTLFINIITSVLLFVVGIFSILMYFNRINSDILFALVIILPYIIINHYNNYLIVTYRSKDSFNILSYIKIVEFFLMFITLYFVFYYGYNGMLLRALIILFLVTILMHIYKPLRVKPNWNRSEFEKLLKTGTPIFIIDYIKNVSATSAPIFVLKYGGFEMVGLFTLGTMAFSTMMVIPISIGQYIYPKICYDFGKNNMPISLWNIGIRGLFLCYIMLIPIAIISILAIDPVIMKIFPKYVGGIPAAKILIIASIFNSVSILTSIILSLKKFKILYYNQIVFSILLLAMPIILINLFSNPTIGAAIGVLIANIINFIIVIIAVYNITHEKDVIYA